MNPRLIFNFSIGPIGAAALGAVTLPIVAWFFPVEDVGRFAILQVVVGLSANLFSLSMHQAYVREYNEVDDKEILFKSCVAPGLIFLALSFVVGLYFSSSIAELLFDEANGFFLIMLQACILSVYFVIFFEHVLRMQLRGLAFSATQILPRIVFLSLIGLLLVMKFGARFELLIAANTLSLLASLMVFAWFTRDTWLPSMTKSIDKHLMKRMLVYSLPLVLGGTAYWGFTTIDRFVLKNMAGLRELAVYSLAVTLAGSVSVISTVFSNLWHPMVYKWVKDGIDPNRVRDVIEGIVTLVAVIWSFVGLISWLIPYFFPPQYKELEYLVVASIATPLIYMLSEATVVGVGISRRTEFLMIASLMAFIFNGLLNYTLVPNYGATGAALAMIISIFVFFIIRTESSAWLWKPLPRFKVYLILVLYISTTITLLFMKNDFKELSAAWLGLLLVTFIMFPKWPAFAVRFMTQKYLTLF